MKHEEIIDEIYKFETTQRIRKKYSLDILTEIAQNLERTASSEKNSSDDSAPTPIKLAIAYLLAAYTEEANLTMVELGITVGDSIANELRANTEMKKAELMLHSGGDWLLLRIMMKDISEKTINLIALKDPYIFTHGWPEFSGLNLVRACQLKLHNIIMDEATRRIANKTPTEQN